MGRVRPPVGTAEPADRDGRSDRREPGRRGVGLNGKAGAGAARYRDPLLDPHADEIVRRYKDDLVGYTVLAGQYGVRFGRMSRWLDANGVRRRTQVEANAIRDEQRLARTAACRCEIVRLRTGTDMTIAEIAARTGLSARNVHQVMKAAGLTRSYGQPEGGRHPPPVSRGMAKLDAQRDRVMELGAAGWAASRIAETVGVSKNTMSKWLRLNSISLRRLSDVTALQRRVIETWQSTGMSQSRIADHLNCSRSTVSNTLRIRAENRASAD